MKRCFKILSLLTAVVMLLAVLPAGALAGSITVNEVYSGVCGDNLTWSIDTEAHVLEITGTGEMYDYDYNYGEAPWYDHLGTGHYYYSVDIADGVTSIGNYAFARCYGVEYVQIPSSVRRIGEYAFGECIHLGWMDPPYLPNSITSIEANAFFTCTSLYAIDIPGSVKNIGAGAFDACTSLRWLTIRNGVESIGDGAFQYCESIETIEIPASVTSIGWSAFEHCTSLTSVTIPESVTSIGSSAFHDCTSLASVYITDLAAWCGISFGEFGYGDEHYANPLYCAHNLYLNDVLVTELAIPDSVTGIAERAFCGCTSLISVTIPESVTRIGDSAFCDCTSVTSATFLGAPPETFGTNVFDNCAEDFCIYYYEEYASDWSPNGETTWRGYPIEMIGSPGPDITPGDINNDGELGFTDVSALYGFALGLGEGQLSLEVGDINGDGEISFADVGALYAMIIG